MGSTQTKVIKNIKLEDDNLNIYVCGINDYSTRFKNKIWGQNEIEIEKEYIHNDFYPNHKEWNFTIYIKKANEETIEEILNNIKSKIFNKEKNNTLIVFLDSIIENNDIINILFEKLSKNNALYHPTIIFAFKRKDKENDELTDIDSIEKIIVNNSYKNISIKNIEFAYLDENNIENPYFEIIHKLSLISCYYNNVGDIFSYVDFLINEGNKVFKPIRRNVIKYISVFNILVVGRPGCGKSTLINILLGARKAKEGIGLSVTKKICKYVHDKYPITLQDTPGFENQNDLIRMINFITNYNFIFEEGKNKIHLIFYLLNSSNERTFLKEEEKLLDFLDKLGIPIFFICTKCKDKKYSNDFKEAVKIALIQSFTRKTKLINHIYCCQLINEKDGIYKIFGIDNILMGIKKHFEKEINDMEKILLNEYNKINEFLKHSFFFKINNFNSKGINDYFETLSKNIIEKYKILIKKEIENYNLPKDKEELASKTKKINELLVEHLAMELNENISGKVFINKNENKINDSIQQSANYHNNLFCQNVSSDVEVEGKKINEEEHKTFIRETEETGKLAKKEFLNNLNSKGLEEYLKNIIKFYKNAFDSLVEISKNFS